MEIGNKLRVFRTEKGYTQEKIADLLQISQASYSNLENNKGEIDLKTIQKIAEIYGMDVIDILKKDSFKLYIQKNKDGNNTLILNQLSEKLIEQYEIRLNEKDRLIDELRKRLE